MLVLTDRDDEAARAARLLDAGAAPLGAADRDLLRRSVVCIKFRFAAIARAESGTGAVAETVVWGRFTLSGPLVDGAVGPALGRVRAALGAP